MLHSMTGYGRATGNYGDKTIDIEIRSVNSKGADFRLRIPNNYKDKEGYFRRLLQEKAERGKVDVVIEVTSPYGEEQYSLNKLLFKKYYEEVRDTLANIGGKEEGIANAILRIPNILNLEEVEQDPQEWAVISETFESAMEAFVKYRIEEGRILLDDFQARVENILVKLDEVEPYEVERVPRMKEKLQQLLQTQFTPEQIDQNRFEQELIFYFERYDITEEKVRLRQHCDYFMDELNSQEHAKGRKLNFISQEMGREINTLGSKANHSEIQRIVVIMKDELEKIKEQLANIV